MDTVNIQKAIEHGPVEIVDSYVTVYRRVLLEFWNIQLLPGGVPGFPKTPDPSP